MIGLEEAIASGEKFYCVWLSDMPLDIPAGQRCTVVMWRCYLASDVSRMMQDVRQELRARGYLGLMRCELIHGMATVIYINGTLRAEITLCQSNGTLTRTTDELWYYL
jgi:hypothetical protein